jgi:beta-lactamase regulating signal transducer with metallopeptidase domain
LKPVAPSASPIPWEKVVVGVWLAGALLLGGGAARSYLRLSRRLRHRPEVIGGNLFESLGRLAGRAGVRQPVRLGCSSRLPVPVALGGSRPQICVPPRALAQLTADQQEGMLAHELAHLVRRDPFWLALENVLVSLFFFQPLNWVARRRLRELSELLCDEWAVARTGRPVTLARCLAEVAAWSVEPLRALPAAGMADRPSHLAHRIRRLLETGRTPEGARGRRWLMAGIGALLLAVAIAAPGVSAAVQSASAAAPVAPVAGGAGGAPAVAPPAAPAQQASPAEAPEAEPAEEAETGDSGRDEEDLADLEDLGDLGDLGDLSELAALSKLGELGDHELSAEELEEISRIGEQVSERVQTALGPQLEHLQEDLARQMAALDAQLPTEEMKKLEAEMEAIAERIQPSEEEMARLEADIEKLRAKGELTAADQEEIARKARQLAEEVRPSEEDLAKIHELARQHRELTEKFMAEHKEEIEKARHEARMQADAARQEARRQLEQNPELRTLREHSRAERERLRQDRERLREEHRERRRAERYPEGAPAPRPHPAPQPTPQGVPQPAPHAAPAPRSGETPKAAPQPPPPSPRPVAAPAPMARPDLTPRPAASRVAPPAPPAAPSPSPSPAAAPAAEGR